VSGGMIGVVPILYAMRIEVVLTTKYATPRTGRHDGRLTPVAAPTYNNGDNKGAGN
jgi:hypothetical protein